MSGKRLLLSVAFFVALAGAHAGEIYKSVGPDGKVVYSDRPATMPPASNNVPEAREREPADAPPHPVRIPKEAIHAAKPRDTAPVIARVDPEMESAVIGVLGIEDLVRKTEDLCLRSVPTSFKRYSGAAEGWRLRNTSFVAQAHHVLETQFDSAHRQLMERGVDQRNVGVFSKVTTAPAASKISWCDRSIDEIKAGTMDFRNKDKLASPLMKIPGG
jgi:hypothetical protein